MYLPNTYKIEDINKIADFIRKNNFGDLITSHKQSITSNKVPFLFDDSENILYGHFGRGNSQLKDIESSDEALIIFSGAHHYISPRWYQSKDTVPTWNFETLQARGKPSLINNDDLILMLKKLSLENERISHQDGNMKNWSMNEVSPEKLTMMLNMIIGFKIEITDIKFKSKMSQNRGREDQLSVIDSLNKLSTQDAKNITRIMSKNLKLKSIAKKTSS